jgi:hypothetical protein
MAISSIGLTICSDKPLLRGERGAEHDGYMFLGSSQQQWESTCMRLESVDGCAGLQRIAKGQARGGYRRIRLSDDH